MDEDSDIDQSLSVRDQSGSTHLQVFHQIAGSHGAPRQRCSDDARTQRRYPESTQSTRELIGGVGGHDPIVAFTELSPSGTQLPAREHGKAEET